MYRLLVLKETGSKLEAWCTRELRTWCGLVRKGSQAGAAGLFAGFETFVGRMGGEGEVSEGVFGKEDGTVGDYGLGVENADSV